MQLSIELQGEKKKK